MICHTKLKMNQRFIILLITVSMVNGLAPELCGKKYEKFKQSVNNIGLL